MQRKEGYRNEKELSNKEIKDIVNEYYKKELSCKEISEKFKLTKRALPIILKGQGIDSKKKNRYTLNDSYFENLDTEEKAYWLGFLYADGYIGNEHYHNIVFAQKESDGYIVEQLAKDINFSGEIRTKIPGVSCYENGEPQKILNFSSLRMTKDLYALGMLPGKIESRQKLPSIKQTLIRHFVRGFFDGDGSIIESSRLSYKNHTYKTYKWSLIVSNALLDEIREILPVTTHLHDSKTDSIQYIEVFNREDIIKLYHFLYDNSTRFLHRKKNIFIKAIRYDCKKLQEENGINLNKVSS